MLNTYERRLILSYLSNLASRLGHHRPEARALAECIAERGDLLEVPDCSSGRIEEGLRAYSHGELTAARWRQLRDILKSQQAATKRVRADRTALRIRRLGREMQLSRTDIALLDLLLRYHAQSAIESIVDDVFGRGSRRFVHVFNVGNRALPDLLGLRFGSFSARFATDAPLVRSGLVSIDNDGDIKPIDRLKRLVHAPGNTAIEARCLLFDTSRPGELEWSDFEHVAEDRDHVESLLKGP